MKTRIKEFIKRTLLYEILRPWLNIRNQKLELIQWERNGKTGPAPHLIKQRVIKDYADRFNLKVMIETGTYFGDMVEAMKNHFNQIYSIELSQKLYEKATKRFAGDESIKIISGDSGIELGKLMAKINQPALFWLDGHYSGGITAKGLKETPIKDELTHIFNSQESGHVVIIDDARCFGVDPEYPSIEKLSEFIKDKKPNALIEIHNDSIRITPNSEFTTKEKPNAIIY